MRVHTGGARRLAILLLSGMFAIAPANVQPGGRLEGTVTDMAGTPVPGVTVTVTSNGFRRTALTDATGRFRFSAMPAGTYEAQAELAGFDTAVQRDISVERGAVAAVALALRPACVVEVVRVDIGFRQALELSAIVAYLEVLESRRREDCPAVVSCACMEVLAEAHEIMKSPSALATVELVEGIGGHGRVEDAPRAYARGEQYVALLQAYSARGPVVYVPLYMFPVRDGRVEFRRTDAPGLYDGMTVEEFSQGIRLFVLAER